MTKEVMTKNNKFTVAHRLIHWAISLTFMFLLLTVLLRMGWMNKDAMGDIVSNSVKEHGVSLSTQEAATIGKTIRKPMWNWHIYAGYTLLGLYIIRMIIFLVQGVPFPSPFKKANPAGERIKSVIYIIFYTCLGVSLSTGIIIKLFGDLSIAEFAESIHVKSLYYALTFIALHIVGLVIAELTNESGIISKMFSGQKSTTSY